MKKQRKIIIISMVLSFCLLIVAGIANAANISAYNNFKDGIKKTIVLRNATFDITARMFVDGVETNNSQQFMLAADLDNQRIYTKNIGNYTHESYKIGDKQINGYMDSESKEMRYDVYENTGSNFDNNFGVSKEIVRVLEIVADGLSGNAKDYFMSNNLENGKEITAYIDNTQMPEIVDAMLNLVISNAKRHTSPENLAYLPEVDENPYDALSRKLNSGYIESVGMANANLVSRIDNSGNITYCKADFTLIFTDKSGISNELKFVVELNTTDIGTTAVVEPKLDESNTNVHTQLKDDYKSFYEDENIRKIMNATGEINYNIDESLRQNYKDLSAEQLKEILDAIENVNKVIKDAKN